MIPRILAAIRAHRARVANERAILAAADAACEAEHIRDWQFTSRCRDVAALDVAELIRDLDVQPEPPMITYLPTTEPLPQQWVRTGFDVSFLGRHAVVAP